MILNTKLKVSNLLYILTFKVLLNIILNVQELHAKCHIEIVRIY